MPRKKSLLRETKSDNENPPSKKGAVKELKKRKRPVTDASESEMSSPQKKTKSSSDETSKKQKVHHHCYGVVGGVALTLGEGDTGQLGLGETIMDRKRPALVDIPGEIIQVCAGGMHTVCLTKDGQVFTFGCNDEGALGRDTSEDGTETRPGKVKLDHRIVMVSAGDSHTAALTDAGKVYAWGIFRDGNGKMGLRKPGELQNSPVEIFITRLVVKIASGSDHLVCLTRDGHIYSCGCAEQGQLGRIAECFSSRGGRKGMDVILSPGIVRCKKRTIFSDIWTGQHFTIAQELNTENIYGWGLNNYCQIGLDDMQNRYVPVKLPSFCTGKKWKSIYGGIHHTVCLDEQGKVYTLGRSEYGRLGQGEDSGDLPKPTLVPSLQSQTCTQIAAGNCVSFALTQDGTLYSWGMGTNKQLASGEEDDEFEPIVMAGKQLETRLGVSISAGGQHTVILARAKEEV